MAWNTFTPPKVPSREAGDINQLSRDLIANFGDGYVQAGIDGLNNLAISITLVWAYLSQSEAQTIASFLQGQTRATPFLYQLPWEGSPRQWRIAGESGKPLYVWDKTRGITDRVEVTLQEDFTVSS